MSAPSRFPNGISTDTVTQPLGNYPFPNPVEVYEVFHDFQQYVAADWTVTNTTSHGTVALTAGAGGIISLAGGASSVTSDIVNIQDNPLDINFSTSQQVWFHTKIKKTTALNDQILVGITSDASALAPTDGIYFNKAAASAAIDFVVRKSSTSTTQAAVATLADNTYIQLSFYYNGKDAVDVFVNGVKVYSQTVLTNLPAAVALAKTMGVKANATSPTTSNIVVDYSLAAQDRS